MAKPGAFAGKSDLATVGFATTYYLSWGSFRLGDDTLLLPAVNQTATGALTQVVFYETATAGVYNCQLANGQWIAFATDIGLNWLTLSPQFADAIAITLDPAGQGGWTVDVGQGAQKVYYSVEQNAPILTLNPSSSSGTEFAPTVVTPSLAQMKASDGKGVDLTGVWFEDADLSGIDFTGADFTDTHMDGATCTGTTLSECKFIRTTWGCATADDATLDKADFTEADLTDAAWGAPKSAKSMVLSKVKAAGATLGNATKAVPMDGAVLSDGDFTGADLSKLSLKAANLGSGTFLNAKLDGVDLTGADLTRGLFQGALIRKDAVLAKVTGQGANFIGANLSGADLTKARMGSRAFLFTLDGSFADVLDGNSFPTPALVSTFSSNGVTLSDTAPIEVLAEGKAWAIDDPTNGPFSLSVDEQGTIPVYRDTNLPPAVLSSAVLSGANASSANFTGADLTGVQWNGSGSSLDHAELTGASLADSLLVDLDLTQAYLSGATLSRAILSNANLDGTVIASGPSGEATRFDGTHLEGASFGAATILLGGFYQAAIALYDGVPLFELPLTAKSDLTDSGLQNLASDFAKAGFPFGDTAAIDTVEFWRIDNTADPDHSSPRAYQVELLGGKYQVFDGDTAKFLFTLNPSFAAQLNASTASAQLVSAFSTAGFSLADSAPIASGSKWQITAGSDAGYGGTANYGYFTVTETSDALPVYGSVLLKLRDWDVYPTGIAFAGTSAFDKALSPDTVGPAGLPYRLVQTGQLSLTAYLTLG